MKVAFAMWHYESRQELQSMRQLFSEKKVRDS
jgi:hypothetical protein